MSASLSANEDVRTSCEGNQNATDQVVVQMRVSVIGEGYESGRSI